MRRWIGAFCLLAAAGCGEQPVPPPAPPATTAGTALYRTFDPSKLREKYASRFGKEQSGGSRSGLTITPPGERITDFRVEGEIAEAEAAAVVAALRDELLAFAKAGGASVAGAPHELTSEEAISVAAMLYPTNPRPKGGRGFRFTYTQGAGRGTADAVVTRKDPATSVWMLIGALHEPAP